MRKLMIATLVCLSLLGLISCGNQKAAPEGSGFIEATEVTVSAEVTGTLALRYCGEGDKIALGAPIALIDTTTYALRLAEALAQRRAAVTAESAARLQVEKADLDSSLAAKEFGRISRLVDTGSADRRQYDQTETAYHEATVATRAARAALRAASADIDRIDAGIDILRQELSDCRPASPLNGRVVTTYCEQGELVVVGKPLVKLAKLDTVWVKIYLPPGRLTGIDLGGRALVDPEDGRKEPIEGWVSWISPEAEFTPKNVQTEEARADLVYAVKVTIPNAGEELKIGMPVMVRIP
jgi:HlyD family secretion protein